MDDKIKDPTFKMKPRTEMSPEQREEEIKEMLATSSLYVGVAPITRDHGKRVTQTLVNRGVIRAAAFNEEKQKITTKSLVKSWTRKLL